MAQLADYYKICKDDNRGNIMVVTSGLNMNIHGFLSSYIKCLLGAYSGKISVIISRAPFCKIGSLGARVRIEQMMPENKNGGVTVNRIIRYMVTQLAISYVVVKRKKADAYIFFLAQSFILPILLLKLMRRRIILVTGTSISKLARFRKDRLLLLSGFEESVSNKMADHIIVYSENLINEWNLQKYRNKISIVHRHFVNLERFTIQKPLAKRRNLVGYIGRFSKEKGIINFMKAMSALLEGRSDIEFLIGGDGQLKNEVEEYLRNENLKGKARFVGWIPSEELPNYLNELKLLIIPSLLEGLPNIMLEAMACGTVVLATPVGSICDVVVNCESGFIMEDNSPDNIVRNTAMIWRYPDLDRVVRNARTIIERKFTYDAVIEKYREVLNDFLSVR